MNHSIDIAIFILVVAFPLVMTGLLVTGHLELWYYLCIHGVLLLGLDFLKKLEQ
jgi:hypothetical protein